MTSSISSIFAGIPSGLSSNSSSWTAGLPGSSGLNVPSRDASVADLGPLSASVNLLAQAAGTAATGDASEQLTLPPLPQAPATQSPPASPTDDHGTSNVVFSDADAQGDLIH